MKHLNPMQNYYYAYRLQGQKRFATHPPSCPGKPIIGQNLPIELPLPPQIQH
jgi:hypothetical protein